MLIFMTVGLTIIDFIPVSNEKIALFRTYRPL